MRNIYKILLVLALAASSLYGQAVAGDPLLKGQADIANAEIAAGAAIAASKLETTVVLESESPAAADIGGTFAAGLTIDAGAVDVAELAGTLAFNATDLLDFSGIDASTGTEGLILPQIGSACVAAIAEGQICWDTVGFDLYIGDGSTAIQMNGAASNPLSIASPESLTVATGSVTLTGAANTLTYHTILGEGATDDILSAIVCTAGSEHVIYAENAAQTITVSVTPSAADFLMDNTNDRMTLHCHATDTIVELARSNGGT